MAHVFETGEESKSNRTARLTMLLYLEATLEVFHKPGRKSWVDGEEEEEELFIPRPMQ